MGERVALVTGGNKGIGLAIVRRLCKEYSGDVLLTARDESRGREAVSLLEKEGLNPKYHQLDITSLDSILALKTFLEKQYKGLDVLINNAGIAYKNASTALPLEQATVTLRTNFTGTLDVSRALFPLLQPHARVVNISSTAGLLSIVQPHLQEKLSSPSLTEQELVALMAKFVEDVRIGDHVQKGWAHKFYGTSKLGVTALTKVHARELAQCGREDILVNACCPGWVRTDMAGNRATLSPDEGAETPVFLALLPPGSPMGEFWRNKAIAKW